MDRKERTTVAKDEYVIKVKSLKKSYGAHQVLKGVDLKVKKGTMLALLGPNGAGKTTTVKILSTLLKADSGTVTVNGFDSATQSDEIRRVIGLTGQSAAVDELLTGRENLVLMGRLYRLTSKSATLRAQELLEDFDLVDAADRPTKTYSGGMRRRLDLAVSLIATPPIIFLDEPTTGLDPRSRLAMWNIIKKLIDGGTTILLTTQYLEEADQLADTIIVIDGGRVIAEGTPKELKSKMGKDRLELSFATQKNYKSAKELLQEKVLSENEEERSLSLAIGEVNEDVKKVLDELTDQRISVDSIAVHKPTLDDVFLQLTSTKMGSNKKEKK